MILVDTSIWVDHLRSADGVLARLLSDGQMLMHPFVAGEISLGYMRSRVQTLEMLRELPAAITATGDEVATLIERHALFGRGLAYVDCHLLAAVRLSEGSKLWTRDTRLNAAAHAMSNAWRGD